MITELIFVCVCVCFFLAERCLRSHFANLFLSKELKINFKYIPCDPRGENAWRRRKKPTTCDSSHPISCHNCIRYFFEGLREREKVMLERCRGSTKQHHITEWVCFNWIFSSLFKPAQTDTGNALFSNVNAFEYFLTSKVILKANAFKVMRKVWLSL